jgi:DNA-binding IclR family transcriptional regulator
MYVSSPFFCYFLLMPWNFLSNHGQALLCIARDPQMRLRDIADCVGITERRTYGIVNDLTEAGYVVKEKDGRRNRYLIQGHLTLPDELAQEQAIGEVLKVLMGRAAKQRQRR